MIVSKLKLYFTLSKSIIKLSSNKNVTFLCSNSLLKLGHFSTAGRDKITEKADEDLCTVTRISDILKCSQDEAKTLIDNHVILRNIPSRNFKKRVEFLEQKNIKLDDILNNPWLLSGDQRTLDKKLNLVSRGTKSSVTSALPLLQLPVKKLTRVLQLNKISHEGLSSERIDFFCDKLACGEQEACELLRSHQFLLTVPMYRMEAIITLLEEAGVDKVDIQRDPWILRYQPAQVKSRLDVARSVGMLKIKPWLARSTEKIFHKSLERYRESQKLLGSDPGVLEFLTRRLGLEDKMQLVEIARTHPALLRSSPIKLGSVLDALLKEGFCREDIVKSPRVLCHRLTTLLDRLSVIRETYHCEPKSLSILCLSKKQFNKYLHRLSKKRHLIKTL